MQKDSHSIVIKIGKVTNVLIASRFGEGEDTLVAVVEVCKERDGTWSNTPGLAFSRGRRKADGNSQMEKGSADNPYLCSIAEPCLRVQNVSVFVAAGS